MRDVSQLNIKKNQKYITREPHRNIHILMKIIAGYNIFVGLLYMIFNDIFNTYDLNNINPNDIRHSVITIGMFRLMIGIFMFLIEKFASNLINYSLLTYGLVYILFIIISFIY